MPKRVEKTVRGETEWLFVFRASINKIFIIIEERSMREVQMLKDRIQELETENQKLQETVALEQCEKIFHEDNFHDLKNKLKRDVKRLIQCPVCYHYFDENNKGVLCENGHTFCKSCHLKLFQSAIDRKKSSLFICPMCRHSLNGCATKVGFFPSCPNLSSRNKKENEDCCCGTKLVLTVAIPVISLLFLLSAERNLSLSEPCCN